MPLTKRRTISVSALALVTSLLLLVGVHWSHRSPSFRFVEVKPTSVIQTALSGERTVYQTYHVSVAGYPEATEADMYAYAERIFADQVRDMADRDGKSQIWITFYLERVVVDGREKIRTFRTIFANEGHGWHRLEPNTERKGAV